MQENKENKKSICVVLDTNIWRSESVLLLKTALGSALIYSLKQSKGVIGLPEIIKDEVIKHTLEVGYKALDEIKSNLETIQMIKGSVPDLQLPRKEEIESTVRNRFIELEPLLKPVHFTLEHAKAALERVNKGLPPNTPKNQQFKDSAIWEAILELSVLYDVYFVTQDKGFYKGGHSHSGELARNLLEDYQGIGGFVKIYKNLNSCLTDIQENVPDIDKKALLERIVYQISNGSILVRNKIEEYEFEIDNPNIESSEISAFYTENPEQIALEYSIKYCLLDVKHGTENRKDATLTINGNCLYEYLKENLFAFKAEQEEITWLEMTGEPSRLRIDHIRSTVKPNNQDLYTFRESLEEQKYNIKIR